MTGLRPTRAGLLTGRFPQRFGHEFNLGPGMREARLPGSETTIADQLKATGYRTAVFGKWRRMAIRRGEWKLVKTRVPRRQRGCSPPPERN